MVSLGDVAVIRADLLSRHLPLQLDDAAGPGQRDAAVLRDCGSAVERWVRLELFRHISDADRFAVLSVSMPAVSVSLKAAEPPPPPSTRAGFGWLRMGSGARDTS